MLIEPRKKQAQNFHSLHKLIYGPAKSGKTKLASEFVVERKPPLFILTEDGDKALSLCAMRVKCWKSFIAAKDRILKSIEQVRREYSCIVIDLVAEVDEMASRHICNEYSVAYIGDIPHGKGWTIQKNMVREAIQELLDVMPVTFIAHAKDREVMIDGQSKKQVAPAMSSGAFEFINGKVDAIAYLRPLKGDTAKVSLSMKPSESLYAGCRFAAVAKEFLIDLRNVLESFTKIDQELANDIS
jgi:hypothetical protein